MEGADTAAEAKGEAGDAGEQPRTASERLERAERLREDGNAKFKSQDIDGAKADYDKALKYLDSIADEKSKGEASDCADDKVMAEGAKACRLPVLLNLALCCLRTDEAFRALQLCEEALDLEPENPKATYRKAKALVDLGELKEAEWELVRACKLNPKDAAIRKELEQLRQKFRDDKAKEKATFEGLFAKEPGFASNDRQRFNTFAGMKKSELEDIYFHDGKENPFEDADNPHVEAEALQLRGEMEDACQAWEAALLQTAAKGQWTAHFEHCLAFGRLLMDLNLDRLAIRCFDKVMESMTGAKTEDDVAVDPAPPIVHRHALLLRAICSVNEVENAEAEVKKHVAKWLDECCGPTEDDIPLEDRLGKWPEGGADASVALGLLQLLRGDEAAPLNFAKAVAAPEAPDSCFGVKKRLSTRWNMLGAVLANRTRVKDALVAYDEALRLQPYYPRALLNLGIAKASSGERVAAVAMYAAALEMSPGWSSDALWAELQTVAGDQYESEDLLEAAKQKNLTKLRELLKGRRELVQVPAASTGDAEEPVASVLERMGFAGL